MDLINMKMSPMWMLVLLFCCGWVCGAPDLAQSVRLTVAYGRTAVLPCDGFALDEEEDAEVSWEAMGTDVAAITGDKVIIDSRYKGRVHLASEGQGRADWSLVLDSVRLSDSDMYECIWRGRRTLSTVWLTVEHPHVDPVLEVYPHNATVTLPCYLDLPRNQSPDKLNVWWEKDGKILIERVNNEVNIINEEFSYSSSHIGEFLMSLSLSVLSPGEYNCWYQTKESDEAKPGIPGTINVILKEPLYDTENYTETSTEDWGSGWVWTVPFEVNSEETTTNEMPIFFDTVTPPMDVSTKFLPMEAFEETGTSYPYGDLDLPEDQEESMDWSDFPWVRTGLIGGVLLVTAVVLCILGVLHKL